MEKDEALQLAAQELHIDPAKTASSLREALVYRINELLQKDFGQLVHILYRVDVHEEKLKRLLQEYPGEDAAVIIADLIVERQLQKIKTRREFNQRDNNISEDEKW